LSGGRGWLEVPGCHPECGIQLAEARFQRLCYSCFCPSEEIAEDAICPARWFTIHMTGSLKTVLWVTCISLGTPILLVIALFSFMAMVIAHTTQPLPILVPSPSSNAVVVKQYDFGSGDMDVLNLDIERNDGGSPHSQRIVTMSNFGVMNQDGIVVGWQGDHQMTVGWPIGKKIVTGPDRIGDINIDYTQFDPNLGNVSEKDIRRLELHDTSVRFKEVDSDSGATYAATHKPVPAIDCVVEITGRDGEAFDRVAVEIIGHGIGRAGDPYASFGMVGIKYDVTPLPDNRSPSLTITQAQIANVLPGAGWRTDAPTQGEWSIYYHHYNPNEVIPIFSEIAGGHLNFKLGLDFGQQTIRYNSSIEFERSIINEFNSCSAKTNIYGRPFSLPSDL
jgi:hypothetical protein